MPSKKLITLLGSLSRPELNRFEKYLESPYFNEVKEILTAYRLLLEKLPYSGNMEAASEKQALWQQLFPTQPYNDGQIRRILSELTQHTLHFLALEHGKEQVMKEPILLMEVLRNAHLEKHFMGVLRSARLLQEKSELRNSDFYFYQHLLEEQIYLYIENTDRKPEMLQNLVQADFYLDCYYISQKLKYYSSWLDYRNVFSTPLNLDLPPNFMDWVKNSPAISAPINEAYFLLTQLLLFPEQEDFYWRLKHLLMQQKGHFDKKEMKIFYFGLINYCIDKKINVGKIDFFLELFSLFAISLENNLLLQKGILPSAYYKNIVSTAIQVKEFAWTESFIQTYTPKLPPEERENALTYNLAKVFFAQQQYEKVIGQLREVEYDNLTYALGGKLLLLKTYYELNEFLALDSLVDSFRVYLRRNQTISKEVRQQYLNVLRFIKKMSNVRPGDRAAVAKIEQQIQDCKSLADKGWIVQKMEELKGR